MDIKRYRITMLDDDIVIDGDNVYFASNGNGELYGLQCEYYPNTEEYKEIELLCFDVCKAFLKLNKKLKNGSSNK